MGRRVVLFDMTAQIQPVHIGHMDIGHYHIRLVFLHHLQCLYSVVCMANHRKSQLCPGKLLYIFQAVKSNGYQNNDTGEYELQVGIDTEDGKRVG